MASRKQNAGSSRVTEPAKRGRFSLGRRSKPSAGRAKAPAKPKPKVTRAQKKARRRERLEQFRTAFVMTRKADSRLIPLLAMAFLVPFVLLLAIGLLIGHPYSLGFLGFMAGLLGVVAMFGRRAQGNAYRQVEGQTGAAAAVLTNMRGDWRVTPAVGFNREQDMVHRVIGRPGVVLVGEGAPQRTRGMLINERKKLARFVGDVPVYDVQVGDSEGQVPLRGLEKHFAKLPRNVKPKDVNVLDRKLKAMAPALPVPKGPMPTSGRMPRGKMR